MELNAYKIHGARSVLFRVSEMELRGWVIGVIVVDWKQSIYASVLWRARESQSRSSTSSHTLSLKNRQPFIMATRTAVLGPAPAKSGSNAAFNDKV